MSDGVSVVTALWRIQIWRNNYKTDIWVWWTWVTSRGKASLCHIWSRSLAFPSLCQGFSPLPNPTHTACSLCCALTFLISLGPSFLIFGMCLLSVAAILLYFKFQLWGWWGRTARGEEGAYGYRRQKCKSRIKNKEHCNPFFSELESQKVPDILGLDYPMYWHGYVGHYL